MVHELKTYQKYFEESEMGTKIFEVRKNDRNFKVGDILMLREYSESLGMCSGRQIKCIVTYVLDDSNYCKEGYVILGFKKLD
jgi:hypothetical protein